MSNTFRLSTVLMATTLAMGLVLIPAAHAQDAPVTLRLSHWAPPTHPMASASIPEWVSAVEKASNGTIKIQVYPSQQLGKAVDHYDMARDGIADITWINSGFQPGRFPLAQALEMPGLYIDPQRMIVAFDGWYREYVEREMKDVKVCQLHVLTPVVLHTKKEMRTASDWKGLKVRAGSATQARFASQLGAVIVPVPAPEARDAIEKGVADAVTITWLLSPFQLENLLPYHMDYQFSGNGFQLVMNKNSYNKLSSSQKKAIDDHCNVEWAQRFMAHWNKLEDEARADFQKRPGHTVYSPSSELLQFMQAGIEPVKKEWADSVRKAGYDPDKVWSDLVAATKNNRAN